MLDHALEPRPDWVPGELYVGGPCLGRETAVPGISSRFLHHPRTRELLLRTGLCARFLPEGLLEILGPLDEWVVDRFGYPVEFRRIEAALERHPAVHTAVARAGSPSGSPAGKNTGIHAWVVTAPGRALDAPELARHLVSPIVLNSPHGIS